MADGGDKAIWQTIGGNVPQAQGQFANPFRDMSSRYCPRTLKDALILCEHLYLSSGIYRAASERIVDYFLTKPIFKGQDDNEREKFTKVMKGDFVVMERLKELGYDRAAYGNAFASLHLPFTRVLRCRKCDSERNMIGKRGEMLDFHFSTSDFTFHVHCQKCKRLERHMVHDYAKRDAKKIKLVRWDPKKIHIEINELTQDCRYFLDIDPTIMARVRRGDPFILATLPWPFIAAIKKNQQFLFENDCFFHMKEAALAGVHMGGWGIPSVLSAFKNFFRLQILYRYDEVMKMDYIVPLRILSPADMKVASGNEFMQIGMGNFVQAAQQAVRRHRVDGADWNFFPFPVSYQAIGGEGAQLDQSTRDSIQSEEDRLLNTRKIAPELYRGNLTLQNAPVGLRLFEASHTSLVNDFNRAIQWMSDTVARYMNAGDHEAELERVTITDNLDDKAWRLQAGMTGAISKETAFTPLGIDAKEEEKRVIQEQVRSQKEQQKAQQDQQMEAMSLDTEESQADGQSSESGMTPMDIEEQGEESAKQLLDPSLPETNRRQQLAALRNSNPTLHAVVIKKMEEMRGRAGTAGQAAGLATMGVGAQAQGQQKAAAFEGHHKLAQIRRAAELFFPPYQGHHKIGLTEDSSLALTLLLKQGMVPILLNEEAVGLRPFDLMVRVEALLNELGFDP